MKQKESVFENSTTTSDSNSNGEINLGSFFYLIWHRKISVLSITSIISIASIFFAINLDDIYKSEVVIAPVNQQASGGLPGQLGGLAALAGVNLSSGSGVDKTTLALEILQSREFISKFILKHDILVELIASKKWDAGTNTIVIDDLLYDSERAEWVREVSAPKKKKPSMQEAHSFFMNQFNVSKDPKTGIIDISFNHHSPFFAKQVLDWLILDINEEMKIKDIQESARSIAYLEKQIVQTNISEVKSTLSSLIEEQTKTLMLANTRTEYMFKVVDPAVVPEVRFEPKRSLIVAIATILGALLSLFIVLVFPSHRLDR